VLRKLEYNAEEIYTHPISFYMHPEDIERTRETREQMINGAPLVNFQNRYISKSGKIFWLEWTSIYFPEKGFVFAIAKDVSATKAIEIEIGNKYAKFKGLANHFKHRIEKDRSFLAYELHEELAQLAAVVKIDIDMIALTEKNLSEPALQKLQHASAITKMLVKTIQRISFAVSPGMLAEFGLGATIQFLCNEFEILNGITCLASISFEEDLLSEEEKIDFFRVCQEALTNVLYHAKADQVTVLLNGTAKEVSITITDNGKGFKLSDEKKHSGLDSMKERADSINAQLLINSKQGVGSTVRLQLVR